MTLILYVHNYCGNPKGHPMYVPYKKQHYLCGSYTV